jgi:mono/diheme cytochrome c family protein
VGHSNFRSIIVAAALALLTTACGNSPMQYSDSPETGASLKTFESLQSDIFEPRCVSCHSGANPDGNVDMSDYQKITADRRLVDPGHPETSLVYTEVHSGDMPEGGPKLSNSQIKAINDWILAGAPNGSFGAPVKPQPNPLPLPSPSPKPTAIPTPAPTPNPSAAKFSELQKSLFNKSCVECHSATRQKGNVNLSTYSALMTSSKKLIVAGQPAKSLVYKEIKGGSMPPSGRIDTALLNKLSDWILAGAKND